MIGDSCDLEGVIPSEKSYISFLSPKTRSWFAIEELVKRLYSLLNEETGILLIVKKRREECKRLSVFDIPYMHEILLEKEGLSYMKYLSRFPILFSPISVFRLYFPQRRKLVNIEEKCPDDVLAAFCHSRNIKLVYKTIE